MSLMWTYEESDLQIWGPYVLRAGQFSLWAVVLLAKANYGLCFSFFSFFFSFFCSFFQNVRLVNSPESVPSN
jgi:hypothetical protein